LSVFSQIQSLEEEIVRLQTQAEEFSESTMDSLKKLKIVSNMKIADIGCGTGSVSFVLSRLLGDQGMVIGVDFNQFAIKHCKKIAYAENITNTRFVVADATNLEFGSRVFDLAYSRFLFQHLKDTKKALEEMIRVTKRGGMIMVEDCDLFTWIVYPENASISKLWHWYESVQGERGTDPQIGRKLFSMFLDEGLEPQVEVHSRAVYCNKTPFWGSITAVLSKIDNEELRSVIQGIEEFSKLPGSLFVFPLVFRVWSQIT
jgi:ubiquinone/menaquinone biosynthesis C-methylase UbiE